jgi:hypothetical protein
MIELNEPNSVKAQSLNHYIAQGLVDQKRSGSHAEHEPNSEKGEDIERTKRKETAEDPGPSPSLSPSFERRTRGRQGRRLQWTREGIRDIQT